MPAGRPTKYLPAFCEVVVALGEEGASKAEMCAELKIHHTTLEDWQEIHPEFSEAVKTALVLAQAWWERRGRKSTFNSSGFNATSFIFNMKNRFPDDWSDMTRVEQTGKDGGPIQTEEVGAPAQKLMEFLAAKSSRSTSGTSEE